VNRFEGLLDEPRPAAPRSITDVQVEDVVGILLHKSSRPVWSHM